MARKKEERNSRRMNREPDYTGQQYQQNPGGQQYYQGQGDQQYYQQGQYYQNQNGQQYYQGQGDSQYYYQQGQGGPQYYQQGQYYQNQNQNGQQQYYYQQGQGNQQYYQQQYAAGRETAAANGKKKKGRKTRRRILFVVEVIVLIVLAAVLYIGATLSKVETVDIEEGTIVENVREQLDEQVVEKLKGYWNIALYGVDSREGSTESALSDTIMVASINKDTKEIKLVSVYRDTYLDNTNGEFRKATECYLMGGPERSINMLNKNLDLDISDFVTVNMNVLAEVVNAIGGVEIDVREEEIEWINGYQNEGSEITGLEKIEVTEPGLQVLNGLQAMSYCRIRYVGLDYERTERQRKVLSQIFEKVQSMDLVSLTGIISDVLPYISTNLTQTEILSLAKDVASYSMGETTGFPFEKQTADVDAGDCVIPVNLAQNVTELHQFLFGGEDYTPSATVQEISDTIMNRTGIY